MLEKRQTSETQRRQEMAAALQGWAAREIAAVEERVRAVLEERTREVQAQMVVVERRLEELKAQFADDKRQVMAEMDARNKDLLEKLTVFHDLFEEEKKVRRTREAELETAVASAEQSSEEAFEAERALRERLFMGLKAQLEDFVAVRSKADELLRDRVERDFAAIRVALDQEARVREAEDDEILASVTRYAQKLQSSLAIINTTDVDFKPDAE